ncbi:flagellar basal body rod protein FlgC [Pseudidiomarina salinarum]|uniref:Flagellar basal-body rod protein FlgC n=1 Tax=Pseudidiomarina salinarum TaxID=435908 RepID=A0A094IYQ5_9GAMM|nr:flagellar basal body rod protein FlgC [Pseudidiomarina salinarum]KFZ30954.1 flagellar basal body rod protein FlgC [Pseudidiomarina salinarum]RUO71442.1 flagellar basal body rod protein FlgC [Pseudidiomarina salinarum]
MANFSIFDIAGSALAAQSQRMNVAASNMANANSVSGPNGEAYRAKQVIFEQQLQANGMSSVRVQQVIESDAPGRTEYQPGHPLADEQGYVTMSNVDPVGEMVNMISASRSYQANVEILNTSKDLMMRTLTIGKG